MNLRSGFRVYYDEDGNIQLDQITVNGVYSLEVTDDIEQLKPGYYNNEMEFVADDEPGGPK